MKDHCIYSSVDKTEFTFEHLTESLSKAIQLMGILVQLDTLRIDKFVSKNVKPPTTYYLFEGKDNINGKLVASASVTVKRH